MILQEDTIFDNRYVLQKLIGRGGFSEVWLAKDQWTHLNVAIKVYAPGQGMEEDGMKEFCGELAGVYDLNHPNLLKPQHVDAWENMPYLIMAYCPNGSCAKMIGKTTEEQMWKIIHDVASGLAYLHQKGLVHQDIKPANVMIDKDGDYQITDFGVSSRARSTLRKSVVSSTGGGTTAYMGPERFSQQPAPTKASDIWSFGAMCFEMLEGDVPFGEIGGGLQKGGADIPVMTANVSDSLKFVITKMLQKETWYRPTAAMLVEWSGNPAAIEVECSLIQDESAPRPDVQINRPTIKRNEVGVDAVEPISIAGNDVSSDSKTDAQFVSKIKRNVAIVIGASLILFLCLVLYVKYGYDNVGGDDLPAPVEYVNDTEERMNEQKIAMDWSNAPAEDTPVPRTEKDSIGQLARLQNIDENTFAKDETKVKQGRTAKQESRFLNSISLRKQLTKVSGSDALSSYRDECAFYYREKEENPFPFALVRIKLEGSSNAIAKAKNQLTFYTKFDSVQRVLKCGDNMIIFLVHWDIINIAVECEHGCHDVLLTTGGKLESNVIYDATLFVE